MDEIKSALEIAMEKVEKMGRATDEERLRWEYIPEGEKLGAMYLAQDSNLVVELNKFEENARRYVIEGAEDILIRNIKLPQDDRDNKKNKQAMDGLKHLKSDKVGVENVYSKVRRIFEHYKEQGEQQKKQAYESLKAEFEARLREAAQQQLGSLAGFKIDVERQPQFQEQWRKTQSQMDSQYTMLLDEYKRELKGIA
jgi:hypothetical protein